MSAPHTLHFLHSCTRTLTRASIRIIQTPPHPSVPLSYCTHPACCTAAPAPLPGTPPPPSACPHPLLPSEGRRQLAAACPGQAGRRPGQGTRHQAGRSSHRCADRPRHARPAAAGGRAAGVTGAGGGGRTGGGAAAVWGCRGGDERRPEAIVDTVCNIWQARRGPGWVVGVGGGGEGCDALLPCGPSCPGACPPLRAPRSPAWLPFN